MLQDVAHHDDFERPRNKRGALERPAVDSVGAQLLPRLCCGELVQLDAVRVEPYFARFFEEKPGGATEIEQRAAVETGLLAQSAKHGRERFPLQPRHRVLGVADAPRVVVVRAVNGRQLGVRRLRIDVEQTALAAAHIVVAVLFEDPLRVARSAQVTADGRPSGVRRICQCRFHRKAREVVAGAGRAAQPQRCGR